jgi:hypothetical protein
MDHVQRINSDEPQSPIALRTAIDSRYPELRERYQAGERNNQALLEVIEEQVVYFVGLEVGRRVSRD